MFCTGHQSIKDILRIQEDSWTLHAPSGLPWPGFGEQLSPSPRAVYSSLAFFSLIRVGGGTTTRMMAVNFRLFTTQDWSLTSEWTHLNTERAFDPNFTPGLLQAVFFTALIGPLHSSLTPLSCSSPSPFTTLFQFSLFISLTPGPSISAVVTVFLKRCHQ